MQEKKTIGYRYSNVNSIAAIFSAIGDAIAAICSAIGDAIAAIFNAIGDGSSVPI